MGPRRATLDDLREGAERCLAAPSPTAAQCHELAARVLGALGSLEAAWDEAGPAESHPYRGLASSRSSSAFRGASEPSSSSVALERALQASEARNQDAQREIARLRALLGE